MLGFHYVRYTTYKLQTKREKESLDYGTINGSSAQKLAKLCGENRLSKDLSRTIFVKIIILVFICIDIVDDIPFCISFSTQTQ